VKFLPPAGAVEGFRLVMAGGSGAVMVKDALLDAVPFVLTVTVADPCVAIKLAGTEAVN
jgi:hypothetical protein